MIIYVCAKEKNQHDVDFLMDYDRVDVVIEPEFSISDFLKKANSYVSLEYLILDIMATHDDEDSLIKGLVDLSNYVGTKPIVYITDKKLSKGVRQIIANMINRGIYVFYKHDIQQGMTKMVEREMNSHVSKQEDLTITPEQSKEQPKKKKGIPEEDLKLIESIYQQLMES